MKFAPTLVALGTSLTGAGLAGAQPPDASASYVERARHLEQQLAAPSNALELSAGTGYTQGFGNLKSGTGLPSVVTPGGAVDLGIGYRISPNWAVVWSGEYAELTAERTSSAHAFTTGLAVQYHLAPMHRIDPWGEAGSGYRVLVEQRNIGQSLATHGPQLVRLRVGVDFRAGEAVALGPMIGADANLFYFQDVPNTQTFVSDPRISTFVFAGIQGRFDIGAMQSP